MDKKEKKLHCRWLHLSDLHLINKAEDESGRNAILYGSKGEALANEATNIDEGGLKWYISKYPVDCIVITGDFFFRGNFDQKTKDKLKVFLEELYQICSDAAKWNWNIGNSMTRLFWCPGNHDLARDAVILDNGVPIYRREKIDKISDEGYFAPKELQELFTEQSFRVVYDFMRGLRGDSSTSDMYEAQLFQIPELGDPPVFFVAINTALSAGQISQEVTDDDIAQAYADFSRHHNTYDSEQALTAYKRYHNYLQIKKEKVINDEKRLCMVSEKSIESLHIQLKERGRCIPILVGHHPYEFLNQPAQYRFKSFVQQNGIRLYLHGHTHIPQSEAPSARKFSMVTTENPIRSVGVGGLYLNSQDNYNQLSFAVGSIYQEENGKYEFSIALLVFSPASYNDRQWLKTVSPICCECPISYLDRVVPINAFTNRKQTVHNDAEDMVDIRNSQEKVSNTAEMNKLIEGTDKNEVKKGESKSSDMMCDETDITDSIKQIDRFIQMYIKQKNDKNDDFKEGKL